MVNEKTKTHRRLKGVVTSNKMMKTVVVRVDGLKKHQKYQKFYKVSKKYKAHADTPFAIGDIVIMEETRPLSKDKRWRVVEKIGSSQKIDKIDEGGEIGENDQTAESVEGTKV